MKHYVLRYGLAAGLSSITLGLINWFTVAQIYGPGISQALGYLSIVVSLLFVPLGIRYYRDRRNAGIISFKKAFQIGAGISLVAAVITFIYGMLFFVFAKESFAAWSQRGLSEAELKQLQLQMEQAPDFVYTPWFQGLILGISVFLIGLVIDLISALILKRN